MRRFLALLLGLLVTLVLLELLLVVGQEAFVAFQARQNLAAVTGAEGEVRILTIGESTTAVAGEGDGRLLVPHTAYPKQLETILRERAPDADWTVVNLGMMGGTTPAVIEMLEPALDRYEPHVIIAMMGIKDTPDHRIPEAAALPWPLSDLHTVDLILRLREDRNLRETAVLTDVQTVDDLPETLRPGQTQLRKFVREVRLSRERPTAAAIGDLEVATYLWFIQRHSKAEAILRRVIDTHDIGRQLLARVLVTNGEADRAYAVLEEGIAAHPDEAMPRVALIEALVEHDQLDRAAAVLDAAKHHGSPFTAHDYMTQELRLAEARLREAQGDLDGALAVLDMVDVSVAPPTSPEWWIGLRAKEALRRGSVCLAQDDLDCATRSLEKAVAEAPGDHANMFLLSKAYRKQERFEDEAVLRQELLTVKGRMAEYLELAKLFRQTGHADQVGLLFDEAVATIPSLADSHARLFELAGARGVHVVVMQYPTFSLADLHKYAPPTAGVSFVDNEHLFEDDPDRYFHEPGFPHSFSHYTEAGAHKLAAHVADHLLSLGDPAHAEP